MQKVSVIIPIYNAEKYLERCIDSVINQSYKNIEIILINDGSTDNSLQICKKYKDKRIKLINQKNGGVSCARNSGLEVATGDYITFVDCDDWLEQDAIKEMVRFINEQKTDIARFDYQIDGVSQNNSKKLNRVYKNDEINKFIEGLISGDIPGYLWLLLIKKDVIKNVAFKIGLPLAEDLIFILEMLKNVKSIAISDKVTYNYFLTVDSASRGIKHYRRNLHNELFINKYINEIYNNKYSKLTNTRRTQEMQLYLLKMYRDGYKLDEIKEEFDFLVNDEYYKCVKNNIDYSKLNKRDKKIYEFINKNRFKQMIKYFKKEINKSIFNYKLNRIKMRIKEVYDGAKKAISN